MTEILEPRQHWMLAEHEAHIDRDKGWSASMIYIESYLGRIQVTQCDSCPYLSAYCEHSTNRWDETGEKLICDLCGADVT